MRAIVAILAMALVVPLAHASIPRAGDLASDARDVELRDRIEALAAALPDLASAESFVPRADLLPAAVAPAPENSHPGLDLLRVALHRELWHPNCQNALGMWACGAENCVGSSITLRYVDLDGHFPLSEWILHPIETYKKHAELAELNKAVEKLKQSSTPAIKGDQSDVEGDEEQQLRHTTDPSITQIQQLATDAGQTLKTGATSTVIVVTDLQTVSGVGAIIKETGEFGVKVIVEKKVAGKAKQKVEKDFVERAVEKKGVNAAEHGAEKGTVEHGAGSATGVPSKPPSDADELSKVVGGEGSPVPPSGSGSNTAYIREDYVNTPPYRENQPKALARDPQCQYCQSASSTTADHVVSVYDVDAVVGAGMMTKKEAIAAVNDLNNLLGACRSCNSSKGSMLPGNVPGTWMPDKPSDRALELMRQLGTWKD